MASPVCMPISAVLRLRVYLYPSCSSERTPRVVVTNSIADNWFIPFESTSYIQKPTPETNPNLWYHWQTTGQDKEALQDAQRTSWYSQTFKWTVKGLYRILKEKVYHYLHQKKIRRNGTPAPLVRRNGNRRNGIREMGINRIVREGTSPGAVWEACQMSLLPWDHWAVRRKDVKRAFLTL